MENGCFSQDGNMSLCFRAEEMWRREENKMCHRDFVSKLSPLETFAVIASRHQFVTKSDRFPMNFDGEVNAAYAHMQNVFPLLSCFHWCSKFGSIFMYFGFRWMEYGWIGWEMGAGISIESCFYCKCVSLRFYMFKILKQAF